MGMHGPIHLLKLYHKSADDDRIYRVGFLYGKLMNLKCNDFVQDFNKKRKPDYNELNTS